MSLAVAHNTAPATRRRVDVREVVEDLHRRYPRMGPERLAERLVERLEEDRHLLLDAGRFLVERILTVTETRQRMSRAAPSPEQRTARKVAEKVAVTKLAARVKEMVALDMTVTLLDGTQKALRFCFGHELEQLGAVYQRIGERVGDAMVGEILVEAQVRELLDLGNQT